MSISTVVQVYDEVRRLAIAGSVIAPGDFRLKKLVAPLQRSAEKAPVFGKVAEAITKLVESAEKDSATALLELSTLVGAILYTQGETGAEGELKPVEVTDLGLQTTSTSARVLKPLIEALTSTGSGRLEIIREAHARGAFRDLRLVNHALKALDDVYGEVADFVATDVLPAYGKAILPELKMVFNVQGKTGHARRLSVMYRLDPKDCRSLVQQSLESGSKEIKVAALGCLGDEPEDLPHLMEQAASKAKEVREAALRGLSKVHDDDSVVDVFLRALAGGDRDIATGPASRNRNPKLLACLITNARKQLESILTTKDKAKLKSQLAGFNSFLRCFEDRQDKETEGLLADCFGHREKLSSLKGDSVSGQDINETVARLLLGTGSPSARSLLVNVARELDAGVLPYAFYAAARTYTPAQVFQIFSPILTVKQDGKKKARAPEVQRSDAIRSALLSARDKPADFADEDWDRIPRLQKPDLDERWLDAAIAADDCQLVASLARPKHKLCEEFLLRRFTDKSPAREMDIEVIQIVDTMVNVEHPQSAECVVQILQKAGAANRPYYAVYWLARSIAKLPRAAAAKIEAIFPTLPEKIVDELIPHIEELKAKSP